MLHGRRQFVSWDVLLSQETNETHALSCYFALRSRSTLRGLPAFEVGGRSGRRQVSMARNLLGYTRHTMRRTTGCDRVSESQSLKPVPSSDRGLKLAHVKPESLVSGGHHLSLNTSLLLAHTARQANRSEIWWGLTAVAFARMFLRLSRTISLLRWAKS